jgi:hypothetical protein
MNAPDDLSEYYAELLEGATIAWIASSSTHSTRWGRLAVACAAGGDSCMGTRLDDKHLREMAGTISRRLHAFCAKQGIPIIEAGSGERKHELAEPKLPKDPTFRGLFLVITGNAPAPIWEVKHNTAADYRKPPPQELAVRQALLLSHHGWRMGSCDDPHVRLSPLRCAADLERPRVGRTRGPAQVLNRGQDRQLLCRGQ